MKRVLEYSFLYDTVESTENQAILVVSGELEQLFSMPQALQRPSHTSLWLSSPRLSCYAARG